MFYVPNLLFMPSLFPHLGIENPSSVHWYTFTYKVRLGLLPSDLCSHVIGNAVSLNLLLACSVHAELRTTALMYSASSSWNVLLVELVSLDFRGSSLNQEGDKFISMPLFQLNYFPWTIC